MTRACTTRASASARRPAPRFRATAAATPPPMPPADMVCISITRGNTSETPARASDPSQPTNTASSVLTAACTTIPTTLGAAGRGCGRDRGGRSHLAPHRLLAAQGHAGAGGARDEALLVVDHVALGEPHRVARLHHPADGHEPTGADPVSYTHLR